MAANNIPVPVEVGGNEQGFGSVMGAQPQMGAGGQQGAIYGQPQARVVEYRICEQIIEAERKRLQVELEKEQAKFLEKAMKLEETIQQEAQNSYNKGIKDCNDEWILKHRQFLSQQFQDEYKRGVRDGREQLEKEAQNAIKGLNETIKRLQEEAQNAINGRDETIKQLQKEKENAINSLNETIKTLQEENEKMKKEKEESPAPSQKENDENDRLKTEKEKLTTTLKQKKDENDRLKQNEEELTATLKQKNDEMREIEKKMEEMTEKMKEITSENNLLKLTGNEYIEEAMKESKYTGDKEFVRNTKVPKDTIETRELDEGNVEVTIRVSDERSMYVLAHRISENQNENGNEREMRNTRYYKGDKVMNKMCVLHLPKGRYHICSYRFRSLENLTINEITV